MLLGTHYISDLFPTGVWELHLMSYIRGYGSYMCNRYNDVLWLSNILRKNIACFQKEDTSFNVNMKSLRQLNKITDNNFLYSKE